MRRLPFRYGFITGALMTTAWIVRKLGWPPLDLFFLLLFVTLVACGGIFAGGVLLAWRHVRGAWLAPLARRSARAQRDCRLDA
jgi:hypothetical protein